MISMNYTVTRAFFVIAFVSMFTAPSFSQDRLSPINFRDITNNAENYSQYLDESDIYYKKGMEAFQANQYSTAIDLLKKALELSPERNTTRTNLAVAYINRGSYFFNTEKNFDQAASDYRNAVYYLEYDGYAPPGTQTDENLYIAKTNLNRVRSEIGAGPWMSSAKALRGQGKFTDSVVEFKFALEKDKNNVEIYEALGDLYRVLQRSNLSVDNYKQALSIDSSSPELHLKFARALQDIGQDEIAVKEFNIALNTCTEDKKEEILKDLESIWIEKIKANRTDAAAHMNLGVVLQKKGDLDGALTEYKIAESIEPNNVTTRLNLGTLFQAKKKYITALRAYDTILQVKPDHILAHYYKGTALKEMNRLDEAINEFQYILRKDSKNKMAKDALFETVMLFPDRNNTVNTLSIFARNNPEDPISQYKLAFYLHSINRPDEAITYYHKTIKADPSYTDAYLNIAKIYQEQNKEELAISVLKNALEKMPENKKITDMIALIESEAATLRYHNALQMHTKGQYEEAINEYRKIIEISEPDSDLYVNLGAAYQALNDNKQAIAAYEKAVNINESNSTAYYYLGTAYFQEEQYEKALKTYQKALAIDPKNENIKQAIKSSQQVMTAKLLEKGISEYNGGKYKEALLTLNTALITSPDNADIYYQRGMVYDTMQKYPLAISDYENAVKYNTELIMAFYALAVDYDTLKNYPMAKKYYRKFIEQSPNQEDEYVKYSKQREAQL